MLRWIQLHPELRHAASTGTIHHLVGTALRDRTRRGGTAKRGYRPVVVVAAALTATAEARRRLLFEAIDLREEPGDDGCTLVLSEDGADSVALRGPSGHVGHVLGAVDLRQWNPSTFQWNPVSQATIPLHQVADERKSARNRLALAQRAQAVVCDPVEHAADPERARSMIELACAGVPLVGALTEADVAMIGADLAGSISGATAEACSDSRVRHLHSLRVRRAALAQYSPRGRWATAGSLTGIDVRTQPVVSVLLPSNRPDDVVDAASSVARQIGVSVQLVVGLHGAHMPSGLEERLGDVFPGDLVVRRCDDSLNLGQVLNQLTEAATADLVSKWDDDDWYEPQHLADLVRSLESSGAALVGKAAEFIYLETLDLTVRRFATGGERWSTTIAGGTLLLTRSELVETGWAEVPRQVDRRLIDALQARGGGIYRTHGFGYVLRRRSKDMAAHTWAAGDEYFLRQASDQRAGLDLGFAGFEVDR